LCAIYCATFPDVPSEARLSPSSSSSVALQGERQNLVNQHGPTPARNRDVLYPILLAPDNSKAFIYFQF
jgi:hypothetical protein